MATDEASLMFTSMDLFFGILYRSIHISIG